MSPDIRACRGFPGGRRRIDSPRQRGRFDLPAVPIGIVTAAFAFLGIAVAAEAQEEREPAAFPTTEFADGSKSAAVSQGDLTAGIGFVRRPDIDPHDEIPLLTVIVGGKPMLEAAGVASGFDFPTAEASIARMDPATARPQVYFTSYSGGAHCCSTLIVATEHGGKWVAVPVGEFDGDGNYLDDINGDGLAEIVLVDNRFLYKFDCYACSAAPLMILSVRDGALVDLSTDPAFQPAHRDWLKQLEEDVDPEERWTSPGFLAGWVASKIRVGEGDDAWRELNARWNAAGDPGEQVCKAGGDPEDCAKGDLAVMKFPDRLKLFLDQSGY